mmetsp:Transcript_10384/g.28374  ORF Transcript_10384/g.28374 Transcript_10384/m.28374 type:complete len:225 (+) Transcript_10384:42-716(+)
MSELQHGGLVCLPRSHEPPVAHALGEGGEGEEERCLSLLCLLVCLVSTPLPPGQQGMPQKSRQVHAAHQAAALVQPTQPRHNLFPGLKACPQPQKIVLGHVDRREPPHSACALHICLEAHEGSCEQLVAVVPVCCQGLQPTPCKPLPVVHHDACHLLPMLAPDGAPPHLFLVRPLPLLQPLQLMLLVRSLVGGHAPPSTLCTMLRCSICCEALTLPQHRRTPVC